MGCANSKQAASVTPAVDHSGALRDDAAAAAAATGGTGSGRRAFGLAEVEKKKRKTITRKNSTRRGESELGESGRASSLCDSVSFRLGNLHKYVEGEQVAAGWPAWLSAVAGEAIQLPIPFCLLPPPQPLLPLALQQLHQRFTSPRHLSVSIPRAPQPRSEKSD